MTTDTLTSVETAPAMAPELPPAPELDTAAPALEPRIVVVQKVPLPPTTPAAPQPQRPPRTRIIAMINQKGGVGKTTSTVNLGAALAQQGQRVLLIDLDPQAHMTLHLGIDPASLERSTYDLLTDDDVSAADVLRQVSGTLWALPAEVNLAGAETEMAPKLITGQAQRVLRQKMAGLVGEKGRGPRREGREEGEAERSQESGVRSQDFKPQDSGLRTQDFLTPDPGPPTPDPFDFILLDCPPSLGLLTINALTFAEEVFVPMQAHFLALQGLSKLLETVGFIRSSFNPAIKVSGIILCMHEKQTLLAGEVTADLNGFLDTQRDQDVPWRDAEVLQPAIRRNIKLAESPSFGSTIYQYAPESNGADDYRRLAECVVRQHARR